MTSPLPSSDWYVRERRSMYQYLPEYGINLPPRIGLLLPARGDSRCLRCARPWWAVRTPHHTPLKPDVTRPDVSCTALCHRCWSALVTPEDRMPYYRTLHQAWEHSHPATYDHDAWERIEMSVLEGL